MNELGRDLDPRYIPTKFDRDWRRITPRKAVTGLVGQLINYLIKHSFNEPCLPWINSVEILTKGTFPPSLIVIGEELHPGEW